MRVFIVNPLGFIILALTDEPCIGVPLGASLTVTVILTDAPLEYDGLSVVTETLRDFAVGVGVGEGVAVGVGVGEGVAVAVGVGVGVGKGVVEGVGEGV